MESQKKRRLPEWMSVISNQSSSTEICSGTKADVDQFLEDKLPLIDLPQSPVYSYHIDDCSLLCDDILDRLSHEVTDSFVGFDMEWPVTYRRGQEDKTAVLQLCFLPSTCYVFHLSAMGGMPAMLKKVLLGDKIKLLGIGIEGDLWKLARDFDINVRPIIDRNMIDLGSLANRILCTSENWSLANLSKHLLKKKLNKDPHVRKSDWSRYPLCVEQLDYAARDAYACLLIYEELLNRKKK